MRRNLSVRKTLVDDTSERNLRKKKIPLKDTYIVSFLKLGIPSQEADYLINSETQLSTWLLASIEVTRAIDNNTRKSYMDAFTESVARFKRFLAAACRRLRETLSVKSADK